MELDKYFEQFVDALLHAFPSQNELTMFLQFDMNINLTNITNGGGNKYVYFETIKELDSEGRAEELLLKAMKKKSRNPLLRALVDRVAKDAKKAT